MTKVYSLVALLAFSNFSFAGNTTFLPEAKISADSAKTWNVGAGITQKLLHLNGEWVNPYGIAYVKAGAFLNGEHEVGGQTSFRYPRRTCYRQRRSWRAALLMSNSGGTGQSQDR